VHASTNVHNVCKQRLFRSFSLNNGRGNGIPPLFSKQLWIVDSNQTEHSRKQLDLVSLTSQNAPLGRCNHGPFQPMLRLHRQQFRRLPLILRLQQLRRSTCLRRVCQRLLVRIQRASFSTTLATKSNYKPSFSSLQTWLLDLPRPRVSLFPLVLQLAPRLQRLLLHLPLEASSFSFLRQNQRTSG